MSNNDKIIPFPTTKLEQSYQSAMNAATRASRIPSQQEYEINERREAQRKEIEVEKAPLVDRKEAQASFLDAMANYPETVAERIGWAIGGNYGYGAMRIAKEIVGNRRTSREAALNLLIGVHEWQTPRAMGIAAWKKLTPAQKKKLDKLIKAEIRDAEREQE